jgi:hypothetical protein
MHFINMQRWLKYWDKIEPTVGSALFSRWLCRHRLPLEIVADNGSNLEKNWVHLVQTDDNKENQHNLLLEVSNEAIKAYLKTQVLSSTLNWEQYIA